VTQHTNERDRRLTPEDPAEETLADRTRFVLNAEQWEAFLAALDAPPRDLPRLERLFREPSVFERGTQG
jgi:uncharacterized protein (DUF1778 family)